MNKHTPGPWHVGGGQQAQIVYDKDGWGIANAVVFHRKHKQGSTLANAKLIAAAPDLLALAEYMKSLMDEDSVEDMPYGMIIAAIAKATA